MTPKKIPCSHLTYSQAAAFIGVTWQSVNDRVANGKMKPVEILGQSMLKVADVLAWDAERRERGRALVAGGAR